ncbi:SusC/RagA family TonB-linked outer membrane protein [Arachidicoccus ginsenosidimutans]|uniref:TonB-dependent receptor n=1 Tax=Arachidicoccus sp. BS20 TaxID=1850526 RepID=UPI0007F16148|nr:TonB-dependent receptor [Arachidicoccus sp. BS20]ANI90776.1 SusC/RagA family TonB-linked outer membrane protein [Arachidicoccus sp. BS20]
MRLTTLLLLVTALQVRAKTEAQTITLTGNNITLEKALTDIQNQSKYAFFWTDQLINSAPHINVHFKNYPLRQALDSVLKNLPLSYKIENRFVYIIPKVQNNNSGFAILADITVHGTVTDSLKHPIAGVSVIIKGSTKGTITGSDGTYSITVRKGDILQFAYIGYKTKEIVVGEKNVIDVRLDEQNSFLNDVVMIGYGTRKKEDVSAAVSTITSKDMEDSHNGSTVSSTLSGKIPGVTFRMSDSRPGASASISIRNMGSALFIIDGIQQDEGQFNNISPNDIESITVLKDASAAVYGVEAANGVILVTTKRGKLSSKSQVNINAYTGWQNWSRFPKTTNNYEWQEGKVEADVNEGRTPISPDELAKYKAAATSKSADTGIYRSFDWYDFIVKGNSPLTNLNLNFTGGTDKINYYVSLSNLFQNSVLGREYKFNRTNIQSNIDAQISKSFKIGAQINGRVEDRQNPGVPGTDDYWEARFAILRNAPWERPYANDNPAYLNEIGHDNENWGLLNNQLSGHYRDTWRVLQTNLTAEWKAPLKGLTFKGLFSYYYANEILNNQEYTYVTYSYNQADSTYVPVGGSSNPWRERNQRTILSSDIQLQADYNHSFGKHNIGLTFVNERNKREDMSNWVHAVPTSNELPLIYVSILDTYNDADVTTSKIGYIGRFSYNYDNTYYLDVAGRRDASYILSPDHKWGTFPSVTASWRVTKEKFIQNWLSPSILSEFKIRASYGLTGDDRNLPIDEFSYLEAYNYNSGSPAILDGNAVIISSYRGIPVTNITWIKSHMLDIGFDYGLFNNKLNGTFDYFKRKRTDIPGTKYDVLLPSELGYTLPPESIENNSDKVQGLEGSVNYSGKIKNVNFTVAANLTYARPYTVATYQPKFYNALDQYFNSNENRPNNLFWGYIAEGQFTSQQQINDYPVNEDGQGNKTLLPGDIIYKDLNGDKVIDQNDTRPIGWGAGQNPIFNGGLNLSVNWKGLDLSMDFTYGSGYTFNQNYEMRWPYQNGGALQERFYESHWHHEDIYDVNSPWVPGKYPAFRYNDGGGNDYNKNSTFWLVNVKYFRSRNIELGYSLPKAWLAKVKFTKARFYVNFSNLFSIDNVHQFGIDPEISDENGLTYPQSKYVNVGVNLAF